MGRRSVVAAAGSLAATWALAVLVASPVSGQRVVDRFAMSTGTVPPLRLELPAAPAATRDSRSAAPPSGPAAADSSRSFLVVFAGGAVGAAVGLAVASNVTVSGGTAFLPLLGVYGVPVALGAHAFNARRGSLGVDLAVSLLAAPIALFIAAIGAYAGSSMTAPVMAALGHVALVASVEYRGGNSRAASASAR